MESQTPPAPETPPSSPASPAPETPPAPPEQASRKVDPLIYVLILAVIVAVGFALLGLSQRSEAQMQINLFETQVIELSGDSANANATAAALDDRILALQDALTAAAVNAEANLRRVSQQSSDNRATAEAVEPMIDQMSSILGALGATATADQGTALAAFAIATTSSERAARNRDDVESTRAAALDEIHRLNTVAAEEAANAAQFAATLTAVEMALENATQTAEAQPQPTRTPRP